MTEKDKLRMQAEAKLAQLKRLPAAKNLAALSPEETRQTLHELRVHQIELEMQNEELRRAQAELEISQGRYFDLYDQSPVGYVTVSEQGLILEANLTAAELLGEARGALVKQLLTGFMFKEDQDIYSLYRKQLFETGKPHTCELRMVKKDGTTFWAHMQSNFLLHTAAQDADGAPVCCLMLSNITERKQAEMQIYEQLE
jgi:PAS domain S-box-containing protein